MPELRTVNGERGYDPATGVRHEYSAVARRREPGSGSTPGWLIAGIAVVALGAWAAYHFGPDFRRYIKMERM
jgi:hypothetical protein